MAVTFLADNFLDLDVVAAQTVSSEQSAFPITNINNFQRRSKVWRSNGYWEITSSNQTLVFRETNAVDLTATLDVTTFSSSTALYGHIKAKMEAVGGSVYTVESDATTGKVKFTSDGAGGGGIFEIDWTSSTGLADTLGFLTTEEDTGALTYTADVLKISSFEWVLWDFGISTDPKAFTLIGLRNLPIKITPSATITLQANETNIWTSPTFEEVLTYNESSIITLRTTGIHTEALRFWRLKIDDTSNPNLFIEIGALYLGDAFQATRGAVQFPVTFAPIDRSLTITSEGGQTFSDIREKAEAFTLSWFGLTTTEKESLDGIFDTVGTGKPFFVILDPDAVFSSSKNFYTRFVKFQGPPSFRIVSPGNFTASMRLVEQL